MARKDVDKRRVKRSKPTRELEITKRLLEAYQALWKEAQKTTGDEKTFYVTTKVLSSPETIRDFDALVVDILWEQSYLTMESLQKELYAECWKVFAILVWLREWTVLEDYIKGVFKAQKTRNPLSTFRDRNLPADGRTSPSFIVDEGKREQFREKQWIFIPFEIVISLKEPVQHMEPLRRLPFEVVQPQTVARGAFGEIEKVIVSAGYLKDDTKVETATTTLACKWLKYDTRDDKEVENLKILKNFQSTNEHVMLHLAILKQKLHTDDENSVRQGILFEWAALGDLEDFLNSGMAEDEAQIYKFTSTMKDANLGKGHEHIFASHLFDQASKLASAVKWLHNGEGGKCAAHMDIKPRNILVCSPEQGRPVGKWKLSDFGITHVRQESPEVALPYYIRKLGLVDFIPRAGTYQPPEFNHTRYHNQVSDESERLADVWALGCVLEELLAFAIGRTEAVRTFRESRRNQGSGSDYFYYKMNGIDTRTEFDLQAFTIPQWTENVRGTIASMRSIQPLERPCMDIVCKSLITVSQYLRNWLESISLPAADEPKIVSMPALEGSLKISQSDEVSKPSTVTLSQSSASLALSSQGTPSTTVTRPSSTLPTIKDWEPKSRDMCSWLNSSSKLKVKLKVVAVAANHDGKSVAVLTSRDKVNSVEILSLLPTKNELDVEKKLTVESATLKVTNAANIAYYGNVVCVWGTYGGGQLAVFEINATADAWTAHPVLLPKLPTALNGLQHVVVTKSGSTIVLQCDQAIFVISKIAGLPVRLKPISSGEGFHFTNVAVDPPGAMLYAWAFAAGNNHDRLYMWLIQSDLISAYLPPFREYKRIEDKTPQYRMAAREQPGDIILWSGTNDLYLTTQASTSNTGAQLGTGSSLKHIANPVLGIYLIRDDCLIIVGKENKGVRVYQHLLKASSSSSRLAVIGNSIAQASILDRNETQLHNSELDASVRGFGDDDNLDGIIICFPRGRIFCLQPPR